MRVCEIRVVKNGYIISPPFYARAEPNVDEYLVFNKLDHVFEFLQRELEEPIEDKNLRHEHHQN